MSYRIHLAQWLKAAARPLGMFVFVASMIVEQTWAEDLHPPIKPAEIANLLNTTQPQPIDIEVEVWEFGEAEFKKLGFEDARLKGLGNDWGAWYGIERNTRQQQRQRVGFTRLKAHDGIESQQRIVLNGQGTSASNDSNQPAWLQIDITPRLLVNEEVSLHYELTRNEDIHVSKLAMKEQVHFGKLTCFWLSPMEGGASNKTWVVFIYPRPKTSDGKDVITKVEECHSVDVFQQSGIPFFPRPGRFELQVSEGWSGKLFLGVSGQSSSFSGVRNICLAEAGQFDAEIAIAIEEFSEKYHVLEVINSDSGVVGVAAHHTGTASVRSQVRGLEDKFEACELLITVMADTAEIDRAIKQILPNSEIKVTKIRDAAILTGTVAKKEDTSILIEIAEQFFPKVICQTRVSGPLSQLQPTALAQSIPKILPESQINPESHRALNYLFEIPQSQNELEIILSRSRMFTAKASVVRVSISDPSVIDLVQYNQQEFSINGVGLGSATLSLWFENQADPVVYAVKTIGDRKLDNQPGLAQAAPNATPVTQVPKETEKQMRHNERRSRMSTRDAERLMDEVRSLREDMRRLGELVERRLTSNEVKPAVEVSATPRNGEERVQEVLYFYAKWCGPCQRMQPVIQQLTRQGLPIRSIDVDEQPNLAQRYHVATIPQCVLVHKDKKVDSLTGNASEQQVRELLNKRELKTQTHLNHPDQALSQIVKIDCKNTPLNEALRQLQQQVNLNFVIDERTLEAEGLKLTQPISIAMNNVSCRSVLRLMLVPLNLDFVVEDDLILVTSKLRSQGPFSAVSYPVEDICWKSPLPTEQAAKEISLLISKSISPESWEEVGGTATVRCFLGAPSLVIRQTKTNHNEIADLLHQIRSRIQGMEQQDPEQAMRHTPEKTNSDSTPRRSINAASPAFDKLVLKTYSVADLIISVPMDTVQSESANVSRWLKLLDLIRASTEADSSDENSGSCSIRPYEETMSVVVRATGETHTRIADALRKLRRTQESMVELHAGFLQMSVADLVEKSGMKIAFDDKSRSAKLNQRDVDQLTEFARTQNADCTFAPKITTPNGMIANVTDSFPDAVGGIDTLRLHMRGLITPSGDAVRLYVAVNSQNLIQDLSNQSHRVANGEYVLLDMSSEFQRHNSRQPGGQMLVLIQARICKPIEEEEVRPISLRELRSRSSVEDTAGKLLSEPSGTSRLPRP